MPFNPKSTITPRTYKALVEIERVRGFLDAVKHNTQLSDELETFFHAVLGGTVKYPDKKSPTAVVRELLNYEQLIAKLKSKIAETESKKAAILDRYLKYYINEDTECETGI